jgi:tetratricopeptide (TPR) repeat protein
MYHVFAAEYLGSEGDWQAAVNEYLEAAMRSEDPEIARRAARVAFAAEAWQQASMAAVRWAELDPESIPARESAVYALLRIGDYAGAEFLIVEILDLMKDSTSAWIMVANLLAQSPDIAQADALLDRLLADRSDVERAEVIYARSQIAVRSGDVRRGLTLAREAAELDPERIEFLTWAGRVALNLEMTAMAIDYIRQAWLLDPEDHDLSLAYADLLNRSGDVDGARQVMRDMPQSPDVMLSRIVFELAAGDREAADRLFDEFEQMEFDDPAETAFYKAQAAEALERYPRAIELYGTIDSGERALAAAIRRAELLGAEGDIAAARRELAALRLKSNEPAIEESWQAEARILRSAGLREEAFDALGKALEQLPGSMELRYSHALLAAELGRVEVAEEDLRLVIAAQPENAAALNALGYTLADQTERYEEAEELIRKAYMLQPDEASIIDSMGWIAYRRGRLQESADYLRKAWSLDNNPEIAAHLGEVLWALGDREEAKAIWREGQAVDDQNPVLIETLDRFGVEL